MAREVAIVGVGMHPWGKYPEKTIVDMCVEATLKALQDANMNWREVGFVASGCSPWFHMGGLLIGNYMPERLGETGVPVVNVFNACATPISALREAYNAILNGESDTAIALAADKYSGGFFVPDKYVGPRDPDYLRFRMIGLTNPTVWALWARRRMHVVGTEPWHFAKVKEKNSQHGALNPYARYRKVFTVDEVLNSPMVCDPLTLYEICATNEGAAAVVLCAMDKAKNYNSKPIKVSAAIVATSQFGDPTLVIPYLSRSAKDALPIHSEIRNAAQRAYKASGLKPSDIDVVELHDGCSYHELAYLEAILDLELGESDRLLEQGATTINGKIPVNPSGGSSSLGEAISAQGLAQASEIVWQLRGEVGERQVKDAKVGLGQTYGLMGNCSICILERAF